MVLWWSFSEESETRAAFVFLKRPKATIVQVESRKSASGPEVTAVCKSRLAQALVIDWPFPEWSTDGGEVEYRGASMGQSRYDTGT